MTTDSDNSSDPFAPPADFSQPEEKKPETPVWGWVFFVACIGIMIATRGGAIWGGIGGGIGGVCLKISQNREMSVARRVILCGAITAALWILILILLNSMRG